MQLTFSYLKSEFNLGLGLEFRLGLGLSTYIRGIRVKSNELKKQSGMCRYLKVFI